MKKHNSKILGFLLILAFSCFVQEYSYAQGPTWEESITTSSMDVSHQVAQCRQGLNILLLKVVNKTESEMNGNLKISIMSGNTEKNALSITYSASANQSEEGSCNDMSGASGLVVNLNNYGFLSGDEIVITDN